MSRNRSFYSRIGITKKDLDNLSSFLASIVMIPISLASGIIKIIEKTDNKNQTSETNKQNHKFSIKQAPPTEKDQIKFICEFQEKITLKTFCIDIIFLYHLNNKKPYKYDISYILKFKHGINFNGKIFDDNITYAMNNYKNPEKLEKIIDNIFKQAKEKYKIVYYKDYDYNLKYQPAWKNKLEIENKN